MLGIGAIEILEANYSLGMCGCIVIQRNRDGAKFKVYQSMADGLRLSQYDFDNRQWLPSKRITMQDLVTDILPKDKGWTEATFVAAWAAFSAGYEAGQNAERYSCKEGTSVEE